MKLSTVAFLATAGSAAAFAPTASFHGRTAPLYASTEAAEETKVRLCRLHSPINLMPPLEIVTLSHFSSTIDRRFLMITIENVGLR